MEGGEEKYTNNHRRSVMDDTRTQQALDELADLFLTGQGPKSASAQSEPGSPSAIDDETDGLSGPAPIRLGPKLRSTAAPRPVQPVEQDESDLDETPLRLHTDDDDDEPVGSIGMDEEDEYEVFEDDRDALLEEVEHDEFEEASPGYAVAVEAVILGNLPGLSGPWLTQYAQLLAQQEGPVAILHVDDDLIDLELVEPTSQQGSSRGVSLRMAPGGGKLDPVTVLEALLDSTDSAPGTILVHLDPQNDEQGLSRALMIEDWTLMSGADDLAVVGGYRMLKTMVEQDPAVASKRVGLMVMGSDPQVSQEAARKFQTAAQSFLNTPVQLLGWQKQMVPVNLRHLGRFEDVDSAWPRLADWFDAYAATEPMVVDQPVIQEEPIEQPVYRSTVVREPKREVEPEPVSEVEVEELIEQAEPEPIRMPEPVIRRPLPRFEPRSRPVAPPAAEQAEPEVEEVEPQPVAREPEPQPVEAATQPAPEPAPQPEPEPVVQQAPQPVAVPPSVEPEYEAEEYEIEEPDLVELLMAGPGAVPGGIAMEARCPHQPNTQLMLDQAGRLHLLYYHDSEESGLDGLQPAMVDLLQARKWVHEHLQLLQLTQRQLKFDTDAEPVLHLFTDRADWGTALVMRVGGSLKLHLLQAVEVGGEVAWFCTPLN